jgi:Tol biopolymer transport system component
MGWNRWKLVYSWCAKTAVLAGTLTGALAAQQVELVSRVDPSQVSDTPDGASFSSSISADGRFVVFASDAPNVIAGQKDTNFGKDIFLRDQVSGVTVLVSHASDSTTTTGNAACFSAQISADGRYVLFQSRATNLISGQVDTASSWDLFLFDRVTGGIALVSRSSASVRKTGNAESRSGVMSADGRFVLFTSAATDLVKGQEDSKFPIPDDVFLYDRVVGTTTLVSRSAGSATKTGNADSSTSGFRLISSDGSQILFLSSATDLVPGGTIPAGPRYGLFLFNRLAGSTTLVSHRFGAPAALVDVTEAVLSADGNYAAFTSSGGQLVPGEDNPRAEKLLYLYSRISGAITLVPRTGGVPEQLSINADGRYVAFSNGPSLFLFDRVAATTTAVYRSPSGIPGNVISGKPSISADGRYVAFVSEAPDVIPGQIDDPMSLDQFLFDRFSGTTVLVSHAEASDQTAVTGGGGEVSSDGRFVSFASLRRRGERDLNGMTDTFTFETSTRNIALVSVRAGAASLAAGSSLVRSVSADGRYVLFQTNNPDVVANQRDMNGSDILFGVAGSDVFLYYRVAKTTVLVSRSAASSTTTGNGASVAWQVGDPEPRLSADGRYVLFLSHATDLVPGQNDVNDSLDVFLYDRVTATTTLVSHSAASPTTTGDAGCYLGMSLSADGRYVAYQCAAADLVSGQVDNGHRDDIFLYDRVSGTNILMSHAAGFPATDGNHNSFSVVLNADGRYAAFSSRSNNLVPGQSSEDAINFYFFDRISGTTTIIADNPLEARISADGRYVAYERISNIYLFDRDSGISSLVAQNGFSPEMSADGRFITFSSTRTDLVPGQIDANKDRDIFLFDRVSRTMALVSRGGGSTTAGNRGTSPTSSISADGNRIAFSSSATDLVPGFAGQNPSTGNVFLFHRDTGEMELVSRRPGSSTQPGNADSFEPILSGDGRYVAFDSRATDLVADDRNLFTDVYLYGQASPGPSVPCTLLDTHRAADAPALRSDIRRIVTVAGACGVPATATKITAKVTVLQGTGKGNLRIFPGNAKPSAKPSATLRFEKGQTRTANYTLPLATNGAGTLAFVPFVAGKGTVHAVVEVAGYQ